MLRGPLLLIYLTVFIDLLGFGVVIPILPNLVKGLSGSDFMVGVVAAVFSFMQFVFAPFWGNLSDKIGRRPVILVSIIISMLSYLLFTQANILSWLIVARVFSGIGSANLGTTYAYISDATDKQNRSRAMGLVGAAFGAGFIFGPPIGGFLMTDYGVMGIGIFTASLCLLNFVLAYFFLPETLKEKRTHRQGLSDVVQSFPYAFSKPVVGKVLVIFMFFITAFSMMQVTAALLWEEEYGLTAKAIGGVFAFIGLSAIIVQGGLVKYFVKWLGEPNMMIVGCYLMGIGLLSLPFVPFSLFIPLELSGLFVIAIANGMIMPASSSLISFHTSEKEQGKMLGLMQSVGSLARGIGPLFGGALYGISHVAPYVGGFVIMLGCGLLAGKLAKKVSRNSSYTEV